MGAREIVGDAPNQGAIQERFATEGLEPHAWSNGPGDQYDWHSNRYGKLLYCVRGSIVFRIRGGGEHDLQAGDRLEIDAGTEHAADVGPDGVTCMEASR